MQSKFSEAILEMQQKSGLKYLILEKKISAMKEELDVKEAQLHAVVEHGSTKKGDVHDDVVIVFCCYRAGMHNSDLMAGQKNVADTFAGQID